MSDTLIDDKIAWHTAKIEQYKERMRYHMNERHILKRAKEKIHEQSIRKDKKI